jgi:hypothetical protein
MVSEICWGSDAVCETSASAPANIQTAFMAAVLLPPGVPSTLVTYLKRCLHKDARQRVQSIGDVRLALEGAFDVAVPHADATAAVPATRRARWRQALPWAFVGTLAADGGPATPVTALDTSRGETSHRFPRFLPDGEHFFYLVRSSNLETRGIYLGSLASKESHRLVDAVSKPEFAPPDLLLFMRESTLRTDAS